MNPLRPFPVRFFAVAAIVLGATVATATADPAKYQLNGGRSNPGDTIHDDTLMTLTGGDLSMNVGGQNMQGKMGMTNDTVKVVKITASDASGKPTVEEVFYQKDFSSQKFSIAGQEIPHEEASAMQGVTVVRRREGNVWNDTLKAGTPNAKQKKRLHANQPDDDELYPAGESAVGDTWTVPSSSLKRFFGDDVQKVDGSVRCKFLRVEDYAGESCAVVGVEMDATGTGTDESDNAMKMTFNLHGTIYRSLKRSVDLKSDMQGNMKIEGSIAAGGTPTALTVSGPITIAEKATAAP